jgi:hypothetical protein
MLFGKWGSMAKDVDLTRMDLRSVKELHAVYGCMREAHIIEVPPELYVNAYVNLLKGRLRVAENIMGESAVSWVRRKYKVSKRKAEEMIASDSSSGNSLEDVLTEDQIDEAMVQVRDDVFAFKPLPEKRPFPCVYLGYADMVPVGFRQYGPDNVTMWGRPPGPTEFGDVKLGEGDLYGHIVYRESIVSLVQFDVVGYEGTASRIVPVLERDGGRPMAASRQTPFTGTNTIVPYVMQWINEHMTVLESKRGKLSHRRAVKKSKKRLSIKGAVMPPPYYTVTISVSVRRESARSGVREAWPPSSQ